MAYEQLVSVPSSATSGQIPKADGNGSYTWENPVEGGGASSATVTIAVADWDNGSATVNVAGVSSSSIVMCSPDATSAQTVADCKVFCTGQGSGTLTFSATTTPSASITYDVVILNNGTGRDVVFIDYDGTELYSCSANEIHAMTSDSDLPPNPSHTDMGLTAQGWNWTLAQIKTQLTKCPDTTIFVGQMYITTSGDTEIDINISEYSRSLSINFAINGEAQINWGDNSSVETISGTSVSTQKRFPHEYTSDGTYMIKIHVVSGNIRPYTESMTTRFIADYNGTSSDYLDRITSAIRIGNGLSEIGSMGLNCFNAEYITIPSNVTSIDSTALSNNHALRAIVLPIGLNRANACGGCRNLTTISYPSGAFFDANSDSFSGCYALKNVTIPYGSTVITSSRFSGLYLLQSIHTFPDTIYRIYSSAFSQCANISNIILSNDDLYIENYAFQYCYALKSATIKASSMGDYVFSTCCLLKNVNLQNGITSIGSYAFEYCRSLESIVIPDTVTSIGSYSFRSCSALKYIKLSTSIQSINAYTFYGCFLLDNVSIPSNVTSIGNYAFYQCELLSSIDIPNSVTSLGTYAFYMCKNLKSVHLPNAITEIKADAFMSCSTLTTIEIPSTITSSGNYAFYGCNSMREYHFLPTTPPTISTSSITVPSNCVIYVPYSSDHSILNAYKTATNWSTYASYMQEEPQ